MMRKPIKDWSQRVCNVILCLCDSAEWSGIEGLLIRHTQSQPLTIFRDTERGEVCATFGALAIGNQVGFVLMNGEPLGECGLQFSHVFLPAGQFTILSGYSTGDCLYIPPDAEIERGGYEIDRFQSFFSLNGLFVENINNRVAKKLETVMKRLKM